MKRKRDKKYKLTGSTLTPTTRAAALTSVVRAREARAHAAQRASRQPQMVSPAHSAILETPYTVIDEKRIVRLVLRNTIVHCRLNSDPRCALDGRA